MRICEQQHIARWNAFALCADGWALGVSGILVRKVLLPDSLLRREITGKFVGSATLITLCTSKKTVQLNYFRQIPCATEQGIICAVAGNLIRSAGNPCA